MLKEQNSLRMKELSSRWKEMGPLEKETYEKMKEEHVPLQPTDLDKDELRTYANSIRRDIQKLVSMNNDRHCVYICLDFILRYEPFSFLWMPLALCLFPFPVVIFMLSFENCHPTFIYIIWAEDTCSKTNICL